MEASPITAFGVGSIFVQQYYRILQQTPESAFQFYNDSSTITRVESDADELTASTIMDIHSVLTSVKYTGIEISNLKCQDSLNGGVLVMVTGYVKSRNFSGKRKFTQVFFLAPQEQGHSYYVLNDIFQYMEEEPVHQQPPVSEIPDIKVDSEVHASTHLEDPVSSYSLEEESREYVNSIPIEDDNPVDKYSLPDEQEEEPEDETVIEEAPVDEPPPPETNVETVHEATSAPAKEPAGEHSKLSYASILRASRAAVETHPTVRKSIPAPTEQRSSQAAPLPLNSSASSFSPEAAGTGANGGLAQEEEFLSVYVRNLPSDVTAEDLENEFRNFGRIKPNGVFIRNRKDVGVCFAFVEFEDAVGVQNAIQASSINLLGRQIYIEERRASSTGVSRGGGVARGRGRGRGNYNRARGNGFHQRSYE